MLDFIVRQPVVPSSPSPRISQANDGWIGRWAVFLVTYTIQTIKIERDEK